MNSGEVALIVFLSLLGGAAIVGLVVFFYVLFRAVTKLNASVDALNGMLKPLADRNLVAQFFPAIQQLVSQVPELTVGLSAAATAFGLVSKTIFKTPPRVPFDGAFSATEAGGGDKDFMAPGLDDKLEPEQLQEFLRRQTGFDTSGDIEPAQDHIVRAEAEA